MRNMIEIDTQVVINNQRINTLTRLGGISMDLIKNNPVFEILTADDCENLVNYINWRGLAKDPNMAVLSSIYHYYYDSEEMKNINTVINLNELNRIKEIKSFLHSIFHIMPQKSNFIGCFVDNKNFNGVVSRISFLDMFYSLKDSKTNNYMSKRRVSILLEDHGFKVLDMTGLNGLTYFHSQKIRSVEN